jgi:hypothetical protein
MTSHLSVTGPAARLAERGMTVRIRSVGSAHVLNVGYPSVHGSR